MNIPEIKPIQVKKFETKQSKYDHVPRTPFRNALYAPSGSGKTVLLQNMILDIYRNVFDFIVIISPTVFVDATWRPCLKYMTEDMEQDHEKDP